jgi:hypothetical protein
MKTTETYRLSIIVERDGWCRGPQPNSLQTLTIDQARQLTSAIAEVEVELREAEVRLRDRADVLDLVDFEVHTGITLNIFRVEGLAFIEHGRTTP